LVTGFNSVRIDEAKFFEKSLKRGGYSLSAIIVNRAFPLWGNHEELDNEIEHQADPVLKQNFQKLVEYYNSIKKFYQSQENAFRSYAQEVRFNVIFCRLPDFDQDVHDILGLKKVADRLLEKTEVFKE